MRFTEHIANSGSVEVEMASGKILACQVCGHNRFHERNALLTTRLTTLFHIDWTNPEATTFVCAECGYIHWFLS